nr:hypothetical protein [Tanacetum cinerariifolium]
MCSSFCVSALDLHVLILAYFEDGWIKVQVQVLSDAPSFADKEKLHELMVTDSTPSSSSPKPKNGWFRWYKSFIQQTGRSYGYMFLHLKKHFIPKKSFLELSRILQSIMGEALPLMVDDRVNEIAKKTMSLYVNSFLKNYMSNNILRVHPTQAPVSSAQDLQYQLYQMMKNDVELRSDNLSIWWSMRIKFDKPAPFSTLYRTATIYLRDHDDHHDDAHPEEENYAKRQKASEHGTYTVGKSSSEQHMDQEPNPLDSELIEEISEEINEAQLKKVVDDMLRQRCNSREEHQYHRNWVVGIIEHLYQKHRQLGKSYDFQLGMESYQQKVNITSEPVVGMIYENNKKEKRVMIQKEIHKFYDMTLKRVLEKLKKHNKDLKGDYDVLDDDYKGPSVFDDDEFEDELEMGDDAFVPIRKEVEIAKFLRPCFLYLRNFLMFSLMSRIMDWRLCMTSNIILI